jgi:hypothetical protein
VDEFSDQRLRERYAKCKEEKACREPVLAAVMARQPPHIEYNMKDERRRHLLGRPPEGDDIDLKSIRRPAFFAQSPYNEPIAEADGRTWIVEFTAPRDAYERNIKKMTGSVKLRGWYLRGDGVDDGKGGRSRALVIMTGGGGTRVAAITDPAEPLYYVDDKGHHAPSPSPPRRAARADSTIGAGPRRCSNRAGFDVLMLDRRGIGLSTGYSDTNTLQQGRDLLAVVAALRSGEGVRALSPAGETVKGSAAAEGCAARGGSPLGDRIQTMRKAFPCSSSATRAARWRAGWAMTMNFHRNCTYDLPEVTCQPPSATSRSRARWCSPNSRAARDTTPTGKAWRTRDAPGPIASSGSRATRSSSTSSSTRPPRSSPAWRSGPPCSSRAALGLRRGARGHGRQLQPRQGSEGARRRARAASDGGLAARGATPGAATRDPLRDRRDPGQEPHRRCADRGRT